MVKSGISGRVISLPKGGGAVKGLGESFEPELFTGTGNFTIPLEAPAGRGGHQPELALRYSTGQGNGILGMGWDLGIPRIRRKTSRGLPTYRERDDTFSLTGADDLVPIGEQDDGARRYRPRTEQSFSLIDHFRQGSSDHWRVCDRNGSERVFGASAADPGPASLARPGDPERVFAWLLTRHVDALGNVIRYRYDLDSGTDRSWNQIYLKDIDYGDYGDGTRFLFRIHLVYDQRPDPFSEFRAGFEIRTTRRLKRVEIHVQAPEPRVVRQYHLTYLDETQAAGPPNGVSLLAEVAAEGIGEGGDRQRLPPVELGYGDFEPRRRRLVPVEGTELPAVPLTDPRYALADLFGNGLPDILELDGQGGRYWRNLGDGRFAPSLPMPSVPAGFGLPEAGVQLGDADGNGRIDLIVSTEQVSGAFPLEAEASEPAPFRPFTRGPSFDLEDPEVRLVDLDGDGVVDAVRAGARLEAFINDRHQGWVAGGGAAALEGAPQISFSDPRVKWGDLSGDGLQDLALVSNGSVEYWPNLGHGRWGPKVSMSNAPRLHQGFDPRRILLGDIDGDGLADLIYVDHDRILLWVNRCGNAWSEPIEVAGTPPVTDPADVRLVDLLGNGVAGLLWSLPASSSARHGMYFLDFTGGHKPYLLETMDNHLGAVTRVAYEPSTRSYLRDEANPASRWRTRLPFPVQVVSRVEVIDRFSRGKLTTRYRYHHGNWDGVDREFRGFARVDHIDSDTLEDYYNRLGSGGEDAFEAVAGERFAPPLETRTWFHPGAVWSRTRGWHESDFSTEYWSEDPPALPSKDTDELLRDFARRGDGSLRRALRALRGSELRTEVFARDGSELQDRPYSVSESRTALATVPPAEPPSPEAEQSFFPHLKARRTSRWERGREPLHRITFFDRHDRHGQPRSVLEVAVPRNRDFRSPGAGEPYLARHRVTAYARPEEPEHHLVDRVARQRVVEIINDGSPDVFDLRRRVLEGQLEVRPIEEVLSYYDGPALEGLPFGRVGRRGAEVRRDRLVLTEEILRQAALREGDTPPPWLAGLDVADWPEEYPEELKAALSAGAGYVHNPPGETHAGGWYVREQRRRYDFHDVPEAGRGLVTETLDAMGRATRFDYDAYQLLPIETVDAAGLATLATYDERVLKPRTITDANGQTTTYRYTPLGLLASVSTPLDGDKPSLRHVYEFLDANQAGRPAAVWTEQRVLHDTQLEVSEEQRDAVIRTRELTDGFGRLLQRRQEAEDVVFGNPVSGDAGLPPDPEAGAGRTAGHREPEDKTRVVVLEWRRYDNKGRPVEVWEPYFDLGWEFAPPRPEQLGARAVHAYDPGGELILTHHPDGSETWVVRGVPADPADPGRFEPSPWVAFLYDPNDNAGRTHGVAATAYNDHWNTPTSVYIDALGRTIEIVERGRGSERTTRSTYDAQGNLLTVTDTEGRPLLRSVYDLRGERLRVDELDGGVRTRRLDAAGGEIDRRDRRGALMLQSHDLIGRPSRLWARDRDREPVTLRELRIYGDRSASGLDEDEATRRNLRGRLYRHYDEAGLEEVEAYDFRGQALERRRRLLRDEVLLAAFAAPSVDWRLRLYRVDWRPPPGTAFETHAESILEARAHRLSFAYDALGRVRATRYPEDAEGRRRTLEPSHNRAGLLESVALDGSPVVERVAYNARGQRTMLIYGLEGGRRLFTRRAYDPRTFRLKRLRTEGFAQPEPLVLESRNAALQDLTYDYDLAGNVLAIDDRTPGSGPPASPDRLNRTFAYDPFYRLESATGRECAPPPASAPWDCAPRCHDATLTRPYEQRYRYDPSDNLREIRHVNGNGGWRRDLEPAPDSNRLARVSAGDFAIDYRHDANGNLLSEGTTRRLVWDWADRLVAFATQTEGAEPSVWALYLYDSEGRRVKKVVRKQGGTFESTTYIGDVFERHRRWRGGDEAENNILHVLDGQRRLATVRLGARFPDDPDPPFLFHLGDHLESSALVIDRAGNWLNREEFTAYGETSFGSFVRKRYRFTGKERDRESCLSYHGARYYSPWLGRWISCDPQAFGRTAETTGPPSAYAYAAGNPLRYRDTNGLWVESAWDAASLAMGVASFVSNVREGNVGAAALDALGILADGAALVAPGVPGGAGAIIKASRAADTVSDVARTAQRASAGADAAKAAQRVENARDPVKASQRTDAARGPGRSSQPLAGKGPSPPSGGSTARIDPKKVRFSQDSIKATFTEPKLGNIGDLATALKNKPGLADSIEPIRLVELEERGRFFSLDNRRLWAFSAADIDVPYRWATPDEVVKAFAKGEETFKFTSLATKSEGKYISVRGPVSFPDK